MALDRQWTWVKIMDSLAHSQPLPKDFQRLDVRRQKVTILKSAHVHRDDRLELEFRG
jgi:hypothetical protein